MMNQFHMKLRYRTEPKPELQPQPSTKIRRDVVGRRPEGETIPSGRSLDEDNEVTGRPAPYGGLRYNKVGHIRRNSTGTLFVKRTRDVIMN